MTLSDNIALVLTAINIITFIAFGLDKFYSRKNFFRIPEGTLHILALLGGSPASFLAQMTFRHKTRKRSFQIKFWFIVFLQIGVGIYFLLQ